MNQKETNLTQIGKSYMRFATENSKERKRFALYRCNCGNEKEIRVDSVNSHMKSCGCINKSHTHLLSAHRLYKTWIHMLDRCNKETNDNYSDYGARGIKVCDRWLDIKNFIEDMLPSFEEGLSIDRINNDKGYEPSNCRWATNTTQSRNQRKLKSKLILF